MSDGEIDLTMRQLGELAEHFAARREMILAAWRARARRDPQQPTADSLTRAQLNDHIPTVLDALEHKLRARPGGTRAAAADRAQQAGEVKHGLHRWQQGYRLEEVVREWGHLHHCLFDELVDFAGAHPGLASGTFAAANRELIQLVHDAVTESTSQYARLQRDEAAGHFGDLQQTVEQVRDLERRRAELIHQAVHDLRGDVQSVGMTAEVLREADLSDKEREQYIDLLQRGTEAVGRMLAQLMELARLEARMEQRTIAPFDAAALISEYAEATAPVARERNLYLHASGPPALPVEGDAAKVRRLLQNLVLNSLKYTQAGGVTLSWGADAEKSWWFIVKDTGPGIELGPGAPLANAITKATANARDSDEKEAAESGEEPSVLKLPPGDPGTRRGPAQQQAGEGIGLSIVKRLCELLDGSVELVSSADSGTSFRILLPRRYG